MQTAILLTHIDPENKHYRFYRLELQPGHQVLQQWGRIGGTPQQQVEAFGSDDEALAHIAKTAGQKERKGYRRRQETDLPTGKQEGCPWCQLQGPVELDGFVAVAYPQHIPRDAQDMAGRSKWWHEIDQAAAGLPVADIYLPSGSHAIAIIGKKPGAKTEKAILSNPSSLKNFGKAAPHSTPEGRLDSGQKGQPDPVDHSAGQPPAPTQLGLFDA